MNPNWIDPVRMIQHRPLQCLSAILLQIKFRWCPVGWTDWTLRETKKARPIFKLHACAPKRADRQVSYWPTPMSASHQFASLKQTGQHFMLSHAIGLVQPESAGEVINPAWVEIVMGFPEGWTDLREACAIQALEWTA